MKICAGLCLENRLEKGEESLSGGWTRRRPFSGNRRDKGSLNKVGHGEKGLDVEQFKRKRETRLGD